MPDRLIVFGSGGHAKAVIEAVLARSPDRQIIVLDDASKMQNEQILGITVSGTREKLDSLRGTPVIPAIGENGSRSALLKWLARERHLLETVIHPAATVGETVKIGEGSFVAAGAIAIADTRIGTAAIINTGATVDHDCIIGDAAHIGPGAHLCGNVQIGPRALVGVGSVVRPGISIGADVLLGAGAVVVRDIATRGTYVGNPARWVKRS
jgi:sugar O-acyltransferase (sialic acid O-acetyltransferase NeuD family)